jgi:ferrous iron transport protein B
LRKEYSVALLGNPNCGKTTLFNELTGSRHTVGNWPGVTVERKEGMANYDKKDIKIIDLPGTYSMVPYSLEETITSNFIIDHKADIVINILDVSNLERSLNLTLQLIEMNVKVICVLNMMDIAEKRGLKVDIEKMKTILGIEVIPISASKGHGISDVFDEVSKALETESKPNIIKYSDEIESIILESESLFEKETNKKYKRWLSIKALESDDGTLNHLGYYNVKVEKNPSLIKSARFQKIEELKQDIVIEAGLESDSIADTVDKYVTHPKIGLFIFGVMMYLVFALTFTLGDWLKGPLELGIEQFGDWVRVALEAMPPWFVSLIVDGVINGVGGILTFLPNIMILFLALSLLEESGYMTRAAFLMDYYMQKIGLSGKAFIPLIMGFGCSVPAIMATRIMEDDADRKTAIFIIPFMSCGARMPIYVLFSSIFFEGYETLVTFSLYIFGILVAILMGMILKLSLFKGDDMPYIMELPDYRMPTFKGTGVSVLERIKEYVTKAGTVIFAASVIVWFILNFNISGMSEITESIGYHLGVFISPFFKPLGFGNWQASLSLITGLVAKEIVVSNMNIFYGAGESLSAAATAIGGAFTPASGYSFMIFALLYTPCIATLGVIKKEMNSWKWTAIIMVYQIAVAWFFSFVVYNLANMFGIMISYLAVSFLIILIVLILYYSKKKIQKY